jgi:hypothetical protein
VDDDEAAVLPAADVLPTGVRRRWGWADALLPTVLAGELLAGVLLGVAWDAASTVAPPRPSTPSAAVTSTSTVVVPPPAAAPAPAPPPRRTVPRNPFEVQPG